MKRYYLLMLSVILAVIVIAGCSSSNGSDLEFYLFGDYSNTNGNNPQFTVTQEITDEEVKFDGNIEYSVESPDVMITMNNLSIYSSNENYHIDEVQVEESVDGDWVWYPEFEVTFGNLTQLGVVLVLDVSESLGEDFEDVKSYAVEFVEIVAENAPEARIGVVSFSDSIQTLVPTTEIGLISAFINSQEMGAYTSMYDAIDTGITLLNNLDVNGRALVTFTDGRDNYSVATPAELVEDLTSAGIRSYTMGLEGKGGVNVSVLSQLAINGQYRLTSSKSDLRRIFTYFAESVSNVYQVCYCRSSQTITTPREIRYKFIDKK